MSELRWLKGDFPEGKYRLQKLVHDGYVDKWESVPVYEEKPTWCCGDMQEMGGAYNLPPTAKFCCWCGKVKK
jgi:hypothetical protein